LGQGLADTYPPSLLEIHMSIKTQWRRYALAATFSLMAATQASAHSVVYVTNPTNWSSAVAAQQIIPGTTTPFFFNAANQRFVVTFSSECSVNAPAGNTGAWTDVDIVVLSAANVVVRTLPPTVGAADAFCASNGTANFDGWETNSVTAVSGAGLPAGNYRVQVRTRLNGGATGGWYGERAVVVYR